MLPSPHFTTINLQENMKNTTQPEPSAWSLADVSEGTDLGSLCAPVTKRAPPGVMEKAALVPGCCL